MLGFAFLKLDHAAGCLKTVQNGTIQRSHRRLDAAPVTLALSASRQQDCQTCDARPALRKRCSSAAGDDMQQLVTFPDSEGALQLAKILVSLGIQAQVVCGSHTQPERIKEYHNLGTHVLLADMRTTPGIREVMQGVTIYLHTNSWDDDGVRWETGAEQHCKEGLTIARIAAENDVHFLWLWSATLSEMAMNEEYVRQRDVAWEQLTQLRFTNCTFIDVGLQYQETQAWIETNPAARTIYLNLPASHETVVTHVCNLDTLLPCLREFLQTTIRDSAGAGLHYRNCSVTSPIPVATVLELYRAALKPHDMEVVAGSPEFPQGHILPGRGTPVTACSKGGA